MYIETRLMPRFCDTDAAGHINNTAVTQWLEAGRMDFNLNYLPELPMMVIRRLDVEYDQEMTFKLEATIRTGVKRIGNKSITFQQQVWQADSCRVQATVVDCYFDIEKRTAVQIPEYLKVCYRELMFGD